MDGKDDRNPVRSGADCTKDRRQAILGVQIGGAVQRKDGAVTWPNAVRQRESTCIPDVPPQGVDHRVPDEADLLIGRPFSADFSTASVSVVNKMSEMASRQRRVTSSGMDISRKRSPASTCASRRARFSAVRAQATVEFTSPTTMTQSGCSFRQAGSNAIVMWAVCSLCNPEPTSRLMSGSGMPGSPKKSSDMFRLCVDEGQIGGRVPIAQRGERPVNRSDPHEIRPGAGD